VLNAMHADFSGQKNTDAIPQHIAIIMDGNGRWAKSRGLPRSFGHKKGGQRVKEIVREAKRIGCKAVTIFAFSTENWKRPKTEINILFRYLAYFINSYKNELMRDNIKLKAIGRRDHFDKKTIQTIEAVEDLTRDNTSLTFNICIDYGGRWDIIEAAKKIAKNVKSGKIDEAQIDENLFSKNLALAGQLDPDLLIRTSGEQRVSNFLLWNLAYSEFYFPRIHWPDFDTNELHKAIKLYARRDRRFGSI